MNNLLHRVLSRAIRFVRGSVRTIESGVGTGLKIDVDRGAAYASGTVERPVQEALEHLLAPGATFYDIGANVGFFSLIAARLVGPEGAVYAFEPVPENARHIERNARLNGFSNVMVVEAAASNRTGTGDLILTRHAGGATLRTADVGTPPDATDVTPVPLVRLDDWIRREGASPPDVVKVDVEGAEWSVFDGMLATIREHQPILVYEIDGEEKRGVETRCAEIEQMVYDLGYGVSRLTDSYVDSDWSVVHSVAVPRSVTEGSTRSSPGADARGR